MAYFEFSTTKTSRVAQRLMRSLPASPRCGMCGAPFAGIGSRLVRQLGYRPSRKTQPCVQRASSWRRQEESRPSRRVVRGSARLHNALGVDHPARGEWPIATFLRRRRGGAFPKAMIDKLIGDEVMALYLPIYVCVGSMASQRWRERGLSAQIRLSLSWRAGTVARTQGRRWSDQLIDLRTCEVAAS
jgi:adenylate cyclase